MNKKEIVWEKMEKAILDNNIKNDEILIIGEIPHICSEKNKEEFYKLINKIE